MANNTTIIEELTAAARGVIALLVGDRRAPGHFDFSMRGLIGSFIAFIAVTGLNAALPTLLGLAERGAIFRSFIVIAVLFVFQVAFSAIVLRQLNRLDGLVPYLVADNWATFFLTLATVGATLLGLGGDVLLIAIFIVVLVIEVNISRLIVTLSPMQIAMFLIAQLVGVSIALILVGTVFPAAPELQALSTPPA